MKRRLTIKHPARLAAIVAALLIVLSAAVAGFWDYHEQPRFCADLCHIMQPYEDTWTSPGYEAYLHAQADVACLDCHEPTIQQQIEEVRKFVTNDYEQPLRERKLPQETCLSCKEHDSYPALVETTADWERNPHASHWGDMECVLCHNQHRASALYCTQCHTEVPLPDGWEAAQAQ